MKKFTLLAATALMSLAATAQTVVGLERPKTDGAYDAFTSTDAYLKSADGLTVSFYESEEMAAVRTTENTRNLYHQGVAVPSDFAWNVTCSNTVGFEGANAHADDAKFPENYNFGFKLNVPAGKSLSVDAVSFDLLVNANPTWRVRILDASSAELYNSGNMKEYNGFRNNISVGNYARITATALDMTYEEGANADNAKTAATAALEEDGFLLLPADFTLAAGEYTVLIDFDYNTKSTQPVSFDSFTIEGKTISVATDESPVVGIVRPKTDGAYDAFTSTDAYVKSADGLTVSFYESEEMAAVRTTENTRNLYHQGVAVPSDFAWNVTCSNTVGFEGANAHADDAKFPENYNFGFKLNVPAGKSLSVDAVSFDLLVNANPTWRVRILDASSAELYNSGNMKEYNGFRNNISVGNYARITATALDMTYEEGANADNAKTAATAALEEDGFLLLPADFTLAAGEYTVLIDFDYNTKSTQPVSFDSFTIEGKLTNAAAEDGTIALPTTWNFSDWTTGEITETMTKDGLTVAATEGEKQNVTIDSNNKTVDGVKYTQRIKLNGTGKAEYRNLSFKVPGSCKVEVVLMSASSSADRTLNIATGEFSNVVATMSALGASATKATFEYKGDATTIYLYSAKDGINIYAIYVTALEGETVGISETRTDAAATAIYNLRGQRISQPVSGQLYIMNGRKYIAK